MSLWWKEIKEIILELIFRVTKDKYKDQSSDLQWNLHPTENAFFRLGKGLQKNYELTGNGIGLKQQSGLRD